MEHLNIRFKYLITQSEIAITINFGFGVKIKVKIVILHKINYKYTVLLSIKIIHWKFSNCLNVTIIIIKNSYLNVT